MDYTIIKLINSSYSKKKLFGYSTENAILAVCEEGLAYFNNNARVDVDNCDVTTLQELWFIQRKHIVQVTIEKADEQWIATVKKSDNSELGFTILDVSLEDIDVTFNCVDIKWKTIGAYNPKPSVKRTLEEERQLESEKNARKTTDPNLTKMDKKLAKIKAMISGSRTTITLLDDKITIKHNGGTTDVPYANVKGIDFRRASRSEVGYIRIRYEGGNYRKTPEHDEFSVRWDDTSKNKSADEFKKVFDSMISSKKEDPKTITKIETTDLDKLDENLRKLKALYDDGILSEEEYAAKKKQLLG